MAKRFQEGSKESGFGDSPKKMPIKTPDSMYYKKQDWDGSMRYAEEKSRIDEKDGAKLRKHSYGAREYVS